MEFTFRMLVATALLVLAQPLLAETIGTVKRSQGAVNVEREGRSMPAKVGLALMQHDHIVTGADGSAGILFRDDSRIGVGPDTSLSMNEFSFDPVTEEGSLDLSVVKGVLSVIAGKLTNKEPESVKIRTPSAVLAVRGTEFSVRVYPLQTQGE